jgi:hypothetical protein
MTGPPYPPILPGSNAIGSFQIGISPIGDIPLFSFWETIISQYANSPILTGIIQDFFQAIDQTADIDNFFDQIMNIDTAIGYGLDLWGRILGVTRVVEVSSGITYFGFEQQEGTTQGWDQAPFFLGSTLNNNVTLSDDAFRKLLFAKALANITNGSIPALNLILRTLFTGYGGNAYVTDNGNMSMTYTFAYTLSPVDASIAISSGVLPRPAGVALTFVQL